MFQYVAFATNDHTKKFIKFCSLMHLKLNQNPKQNLSKSNKEQLNAFATNEHTKQFIKFCSNKAFEIKPKSKIESLEIK